MKCEHKYETSTCEWQIKNIVKTQYVYECEKCHYIEESPVNERKS
jgi:hypothetical protein